jgi:hypothetical protein
MIGIFLFFVTSPLSAKAPYTEFKVGYMDPNATKAGYLFGVNLGQMIDESLSWSFEFNYFQRVYNKITTVDEIQFPSGISPTEKQKELEYKTYIIPLFLKLNLENQLGYKSPFFLRGSGGLGWEMVWNKENNYLNDSRATRFYHGFGWQLTAGIGLQISSSANLFVDGMYNGSKTKRNQETNEDGLPSWEELDISGFGVRVGVSIVGFRW